MSNITSMQLKDIKQKIAQNSGQMHSLETQNRILISQYKKTEKHRKILPQPDHLESIQDKITELNTQNNAFIAVITSDTQHPHHTK